MYGFKHHHVKCFDVIKIEISQSLTYFITFIAVVMFRDHKYVNKYIKPYKIGYIGDFIRYCLL